MPRPPVSLLRQLAQPTLPESPVEVLERTAAALATAINRLPRSGHPRLINSMLAAHELALDTVRAGTQEA